MPRPSFDNEVSHSPEIDQTKLFTDFKREFSDSLRQIDRRGLIEHEKTFLNSLELLTNLLDKKQKPSYEDILKIYHKVYDTLHREKFSPVIDTLKEILQKYVPFSDVPREKTVESKEKILSDWKFEIRTLTRTAVDESSKMFPSSFSAENRWVKQIEKEIDLLFQSTTLHNFEQKKITFQDWITNKIFSLPKTSQAYKLLQKIKSFLDTGEKTPEPANIFHFKKPLESGQSTFQREILPQSLEIRRKFLKLLDHVEVIRSKQLTSPTEQRVHLYLRTQIDALTEDNWKEKLLMLQKRLLPLTAKTNSDNFKQLRSDFLAAIENIFNPEAVPSEILLTEKPVTGPIPLDFDSLVNQPVVSVSPDKVFPGNDSPPADLPIEAVEPPILREEAPNVLPTIDGEVTFDPSVIQEQLPPESSYPDEAGEIELEPFTPEGELPAWEDAHHVTPGTRVLQTLPPNKPSSPTERPTIEFDTRHLARLRDQMRGLSTVEQEITSPPVDLQDEDSPFKSSLDALTKYEELEQTFIFEQIQNELQQILESFSINDFTEFQEKFNFQFIQDSFKEINVENYRNILQIILKRIDMIDDEDASDTFKKLKELLLPKIEKILSYTPTEVNGRRARYYGKFDSQGKFHEPKGKLIIFKHTSNIGQDDKIKTTRKEENIIEGNFEHGKILGEARFTYLSSFGPIEVSGPVDEDFQPHGMCTAANINERILFIGTFDHGTPFEGKFYELLSESAENSKGRPLLDGIHFATIDLHPTNDFGNLFFDSEGNRLLDEDGNPLPDVTPRTRNYDSAPSIIPHTNTEVDEDDLENPDDSDERPWGELPTMVGHMSDFADDSIESAHQAEPVQEPKPLIPESKEKTLVFQLPDGTEATYKGKLDAEGKPHDGGGMLTILGDKPRVVYVPYENGFAAREEATVHFSPSHRVDAILVGPLDINFLPDGEMKGQIHLEENVYEFEGEVNHGNPREGLLHSTNPEYRYHGPVTNEFLPNDEEVMSSLGIIPMTDAEQTIEFPGGISDQTIELPEIDQGYTQRIEKFFARTESLLPKGSSVNGAEYTIFNNFKWVYNSHKHSKNALIAGLSEYLRTIHVYVNTDRVNEDGEEKYSEQFRTFLDSLQNICDAMKEDRDTGEFYFGITADPTTDTESEMVALPPQPTDHLTTSDTTEMMTVTPPEELSATQEEAPPMYELSRNVRLLRTQIRYLISDTLGTGLLSKKERDFLLKDFSMSLRRNNFIDMTDFLETISEGQKKLQVLEKDATPTFRAFCGNLEALTIPEHEIIESTKTIDQDIKPKNSNDSAGLHNPILDEEETETISTPVVPTDVISNERHLEQTRPQISGLPPEDFNDVLTIPRADDEPDSDEEAETDVELFEPEPVVTPPPKIVKEKTAVSVTSDRPERVEHEPEPSIILETQINSTQLQSRIDKFFQSNILPRSFQEPIWRGLSPLFESTLPISKKTLTEKISQARTDALKRLAEKNTMFQDIAFEDIQSSFESPEPLIIFPWQKKEKMKKEIRKDGDAQINYALWQLFLHIDEIIL